ncbi:hypothetical protein RU95_GL001905 [Enterococcus avium]|nr:hypothetical protein RU95_GL001905 [Enterococcus avium]
MISNKTSAISLRGWLTSIASKATQKKGIGRGLPNTFDIAK